MIEKILKNKISLNRECPGCRNKSDGKIVSTIKMAIPEGVNLADEYDIVTCSKCGTCYADTSSTAEDYNDYYCNHNYYGGGWTCNSITENDSKVIVRMLDSIFDKNVSITDMGCGGGYLLKYLKKQGYDNVYGVDPSKESIDHLGENGINGCIGSIYDKPEGASVKSDVVIMSNVLEHLYDPDIAVRNIRDYYLKEGGYFIVSWPYFEDLIIDNTPVLNNFNHEHINYFSVMSADSLFGRCGFSRVENHVSMAFEKNGAVGLSNTVIYKAVDRNWNDSMINKDDHTAGSISEYINRTQKEEDEIIHFIDTCAKSHRELIVWGTGSYMMHLMAVSSLKDCNILYFVDNNRLKTGTKLYGIDVVGSDSVAEFDGAVLVTAMLYGKEIEKQIRDMGNTESEVIYPHIS